ncbi:GTP-binding protein [Blautia sp. An249]|uniref:GTP-binding protein n=1 Tax=Blautia sp. An249 TaxID=1965603 RepID=UPI0013A5FA81|nr:GTP-binding protein [Blautia sp. An249]
MKSESYLSQIPVDIVAGFPGAGKTSYLRGLLETAYKNSRICLFLNEEGKETYPSLSSLSIHPVMGGCICCSAQTELVSRIRRCLQEEAPERILIELSGRGNMRELLSLFSYLPQCRPNQLLYLLDAGRFSAMRTVMGSLFFRQLRSSPVILLNRFTRLPKEERNFILKEIKAVNREALLFSICKDLTADIPSCPLSQPELSSYLDPDGFLSPRTIAAFCSRTKLPSVPVLQPAPLKIRYGRLKK